MYIRNWRVLQVFNVKIQCIQVFNVKIPVTRRITPVFNVKICMPVGAIFY